MINEEPELQFAQALCDQSGYAMDVRANRGVYAFQFHKVTPRVTAMETKPYSATSQRPPMQSITSQEEDLKDHNNVQMPDYVHEALVPPPGNDHILGCIERVSKLQRAIDLNTC